MPYPFKSVAQRIRSWFTPRKPRTVHRSGLRLEPLEDRLAPSVSAFIDPNPAPGNSFGHSTVALSTGNVVITAPFDDAGGTDAGAVYLFNGATGQLISTLRGSSAGDQIGNNGVTALSNGNYVVRSSSWDNGASVDAGAVTFGSGTTGIAGVVSAANSLVGSTAGDNVGAGGITALSNGNYVVSSSSWDNGTIVNAGAVTFGSGTTGVAGTVSAANSLVGSKVTDSVGSGGITALSNGNYVVSSSSWDNGLIVNVGAVTFGSGTTGIAGTVSAANSLVGSKDNDEVGGVAELSNGNYLVSSVFWNNGAGAVTFASGTAGIAGTVSAANSLVGSKANDNVGSGITALSNGNYVVRSSSWDNGAIVDAGAVTFGSGTTGITGTVSAANSLVGSKANDNVGSYGATGLSNGNYVVSSPNWDNGAIVNAGAVTFGSGTTGITGTVSAANSLVGSKANDNVGIHNSVDGWSITALSNGNYVVSSPNWDNGAITDAGAVTFGSGTTGITGTISAANSLVGSNASDQIGIVIALSNANYVVKSVFWNNYAGAVTFGSGTTGITGTVSAANSLVGSIGGNIAGDTVGAGGVTALSNGNYVVSTPNWDNGAIVNAGAVTFGSGTIGIAGSVSAANSLVGSKTFDRVGGIVSGDNGVTALSNGNYVVRTVAWDNGTVADVGAVTFASGTTGIVGTVSVANSLVGSTAGDTVGSSGVTALSNGNYVVSSSSWDNGLIVNAGAVTFGSGTTGIVGPVSVANSLVGSTAGDTVGSRDFTSGGSSSGITSGITALSNGNYVVRSIFWDDGAIVNAGAVTFGSGTTGVSGTISMANSLIGAAPNSNLQPVILDNVNNSFFGRFLNESGGRVRVGAQTTISLDPVADPPAMLEDAGQQTVNLTGITGGGVLTVTATSSNPALIPDPTVSYTTFASTATVTYAPAANANGTAVITVTVTDSANALDTVSQTFTVTVLPVNIGPPSIIVIHSTSPSEGGTAEITVTASAAAQSVLIYDFDFNDDGIYEVNGSSNVGSHTFADNGTYTVGVRVRDDVYGGQATSTKTVIITNVAPTISISGATSVDEGVTYTLTLGSVVDPGADTVTSYRINWGDGSVSIYAGSPNGLSEIHTYGIAAPGGTARTITVDLTDEDGTYLGASSKTITVVGNTVLAWGQNLGGSQSTAAPVSNLTNVISVAGGWHGLALRSDGTVWAWGYNNYGQLGNGNETNSSTPVQVSGLSEVTALAAGGGHSLAPRSDGTVWAWGDNILGQLGNGNQINSSTPVQVSGLSEVTALAAGAYHSLALRSDGTVWAWGANFASQLGNGNEINSSTPVQVSGLSEVTALAAGSHHSLALRSDGTVRAWGYNFYGQLGNGNEINSSTPVQVSGLSEVTALAAGYAHSLALRSDGTVRAWGFNFDGQLGNGNETNSSTPVQVSGLFDVTALAAGRHHSLALRSNGTVRAWGINILGQLGDGTTTSRSTPVPVNNATGVASISAMHDSSLARLALQPGKVAKKKAVNGYLVGATAFFDANKNGVLDSDEPSAPTDETGAFAIVIASSFDTNGNDVIDDAEGQWVITGGTDSSTGLPAVNNLTAPATWSVVTPLTTLVSTLAANSGLSLEEAASRVEQALGLPDVDLSSLDPIAQTLAGDTAAAEVFAAHALVQDTIAQTVAVLQGAGAAPPLEELIALVMAQIASQIAAPDSSFDFGDAAVIGTLLHEVAVDSGITLDPTLLAGASSVIAATNQAIEDIPVTGDIAFLFEIAQVKSVSQGVVAAQLEAAAQGNADIADVVANNTGAALATQVAAAVSPPTLIVPANIHAEASSAAGAVVTFTVSATNLAGEVVPVVCDFPSGSQFALGVTTVTCSATFNGVTVIATFTVTVADTVDPTTFTVTNLLDDGSVGSLRWAVEQANVNAGADTVIFAPGLTGAIVLTAGEIAITDDVTITGPGSDVVWINGNGTNRIFRVDDGTSAVKSVTLSGLYLHNGNASSGGAILNVENLSIANTILAANYSSYRGGGIYNDGGTLSVETSTFTQNFSEDAGGAIASGPNGGTISVTTSTLDNNRSGYYGGAIFAESGNLTLTASTFYLNYTYEGGGGALFFGPETSANLVTGSVTNCTFSENGTYEQWGLGGAILISGGNNATLTVLSSTVANSWGGSSFAIYNGGTLHMRNTLSNSGVNAVVTDQWGEFVGESNLFGDSASLLLGPLADNGGPTWTHALLPGSPAINAGNNAFIPEDLLTDQRGFDRVAYGTVDIGATEHRPTANPYGAQISLDVFFTGSHSGRVTGTDPEGNPLTSFAKVTDPAHGTLEFHADGTFIYTPSANFNGIDRFTFLGNDGIYDSPPATAELLAIPIRTWDGEGGDGLWTTAANWVGDVAPEYGDHIHINVDPQTTLNDFDPGINFSSIILTAPNIVLPDGTALGRGFDHTIVAGNIVSTGTIQIGGSSVTIRPGGSLTAVAVELGLFKNLFVDGEVNADVVVRDGGYGYLTGSGQINGQVIAESGGTVNPNDGARVLTIVGSLTLEAGSFFAVELYGTAPPTNGHGQFLVMGAVDITGANLIVSLPYGFGPSLGNSFTIVDNDGTDSVTGAFANLPEGATATFDGITYRISYVGGDGNDVALTVQMPNTAPTADPQSTSATQDGEVEITLAGSDSETPANQLVYTITELPTEGTLYDGTREVEAGDTFIGPPTLRYVSALAGSLGEVGFQFTVTDGDDQTSAPVGVTIAVLPAVADGAVTKNDGVVRIGGTAGDDHIVVLTSGANLLVRFYNPDGTTLLNTQSVTLAGVTEIRAWGRAGNDLISLSSVNVNAFVSGGDGNDTLTGSGGSDLLVGGTGDDTYLFPTAAALQTDTVVELADEGTDTLSFSGLAAADGVTVNLASSTTTVATHANRTVLTGEDGQAANIENATGGAGADHLIGNAAGNVLTGNAGNDTLTGVSGNDSLIGKKKAPKKKKTTTQPKLTEVSANDTLIGGGGIDTLIEARKTDFTLTDTALAGTDGGSATLATIEVAQLTSEAGNTIFDVSGWTSTTAGSSLTSAGGSGTVVATRNANMVLTDAALSIGGGTISLTGITRAELAGGIGNNTFTVTGWTGTGSVAGSDGTDKIVAAKDEDFVLSNEGLASTDGMALTLAGVERATLTGGSADNAFDVGEWSGTGSLTGGGGVDTLYSTRDANVTLTNTSLVGSVGTNLTLAGIGAANLTGGAGNNLFTLSGWSGAAAVSGGGGSDTIAVTRNVDFTLTDTGLDLSDGTSLDLSGISAANLTGGTGDNTFDVTDWTGTGTLTGSGGTDTVVAIRDADFTLSSTALVIGGATLSLATIEVAQLTGGASDNTFDVGGWTSTTAGSSLTSVGGSDIVIATRNANMVLTDSALMIGTSTLLLDDITEAHLTGGTSGNTFTVSGWTGTGSVDGGGGTDTIVAAKDEDFTLSDAGLATTDGMALTLSGIERATLTGGASGNTFDVGGWTSTTTGSVITGGGGSDAVIATRDANIALTNTALTVSGSAAITLAGIGAANLTGGAGNNTFTLSSWTGAAAVSGGGGADTIAVTRNVDFTLTDAGLDLSDGTALDLSGISAANLTGGAGNNTFNVTGWTGTGTLTGSGGTDTVVAIRDADFTLSSTALIIGGATLSLATIEVAQLTGGASDNTFNVGGWTSATPGSSLTGGGGLDTVTATRNANMVLTDAALMIGTSTLLLDDITEAHLTGGTSGNTFTLSGWTGTGSVDGGGGTDTVVAAKDEDFTLSDAGLATTDGMALTLAGVERANLTGGASSNTFDVGGWTSATTGSVITGGGGGDAVIATRDADFILTNTALTIASGASLGLSGIAMAHLTGGTGDNVFTFSGWTHAATVTGGGGLDTVSATKNTNMTLTDTQLSADDGLNVALSGIGRATLTGGAGNNLLDASAFTGVTVLTGIGGNDTLLGGSGDDHLIGGAGADILIGGTGNDTLDGGGGNDILDGGEGDDTLIGGPGNDTLDGVPEA